MIRKSVLSSSKRLKLWKRCKRFERLRVVLFEMLRKKVKSEARQGFTDKKLHAAVLYGPRNFKLECIPEKVILPHQVRIDVHYCGLTDTDALLWAGEHYRVAEPAMVLGFEVTGTILEMGRLAYEKTGYQRGEEVVAHSYPDCGGFAEACVAHYRDVFRLEGRRLSMVNAAAVIEDYFSSFLALGRRAGLRRGEYFLVNTNRSRVALAVIDLATRVFGTKAIVACDSSIREEMCYELGADAVLQRNDDDDGGCLRERCKEITGQSEIRLIIETESGPYLKNIVKCLRDEGSIALLGCARERMNPNFYLPSNHTIFTASAEHYKVADTLVYRETVEQLLDYRSDCTICPRISAIFGLNRIDMALNHYTTVPDGKVLIDLKNRDRLPLDFERSDENLEKMKR